MNQDYYSQYYGKYEPVFGFWHITRFIGEGSFGRVFELEREDFGQVYKAALKAITVPASESELQEVLSEGMSGQSARDYFGGFVGDLVKEFALMSKLKGTSNVVSYENHQVIGHKDGVGWDILIQMELLTPLNDYIRKQEITRQDVIKLGIHMCRALELCQRYNIIHRDLKPENIFVSENGDFKLGDFGIARTVEKTTGGLSKKGTYNYMAPEVYRGEPYGSTVDIYSLGIVLYRLLNENRLPFLPGYPAPITHTDRENALARRMGGGLLPLPVHGEGRLGEIILKACAYRPADRYSSPAQMRQELEAIAYSRGEAAYIYPKGDGLPQKSEREIETGEVTVAFGNGLQEELSSQRTADKELEKTVSVFDQTGKGKPEKDDMRRRREQVEPELDSGQSSSQPSKHRVKKWMISTGIVAAAILLMLFIGISVFQGKERNSGSDTRTADQGKTDQNPGQNEKLSGSDQETEDSAKSGEPVGETYHIGICQFVWDDALDAATEGFRDALTEKLGDRVTFDIQNAEGTIDTCSDIADQFVSSGVDLILANGAVALQAAAETTSSIPILGTSITDYPAALGMPEWTGVTGRNVSGICDLIPQSEQAAMIEEMFSDPGETVFYDEDRYIMTESGIYVPGQCPNIAYQTEKIKEELDQRDLRYSECLIDSIGSVDIGEIPVDTRLLYIPSEHTARISDEVILYAIGMQGEYGDYVIVTGDDSWISQCVSMYEGPIAFLSASYYDMGYQAGLMAYEVLENGADVSAMEVQYISKITKTYIEDNTLLEGFQVPDDYEKISWSDWAAYAFGYQGGSEKGKDAEDFLQGDQRAGDALGVGKVMGSSGAGIRREPDSDSDLIGTAENGQRISIKSEVKDANGYTWYEIYLDVEEYSMDAGETGYVRSDLVEITEWSN